MKSFFTRLQIAVIFFSFPIYIEAQPGGGGGVVIGGIYEDNGRPICERDSFTFRSFILTDDKPHTSIRYENRSDTSYKHFYLKGFGNAIIGEVESNHRLLIRKHHQLMIIDLLSIMNENGGGIVEEIDTIIFKSGYYRLNLRPWKNDNQRWEVKDQELLRRGITLSTTPVLIQNGWLSYSSEMDTSFLLEKNLTAFYFLQKAQQSYCKLKYDTALWQVQQAMKLIMTSKEKEWAFTMLHQVFFSMGQTHKAINAITEAIQLTSVFYHKTDYYQQRIQLLTTERRYVEALQDYDSIIALNKANDYDAYEAIRQRAVFKIDYLHLYKEAIQDLQGIIHATPTGNDHPFYYFDIGVAQYRLGLTKEAFKTWWLQIEDKNCLYYSQCLAPAHYDSIIQKYPSQPILYICRAIAYKTGCYINNAVLDTAAIQNAIQDITKAEQLGFTDYRIHLYKAAIFRAVKEYEKALTELDKGIAINQNDSRLYLYKATILKDTKEYEKALAALSKGIIHNQTSSELYLERYYVRQILKLTKSSSYEYNDDPDFRKAKELQSQKR